MTATVSALHRSSAYTFSKESVPEVRLLAGLGVEDDVHCGSTVRHRSRVERDPNQPNLRQVHLFDAEILAALAAEGFALTPGILGENITVAGLDSLSLPTGTLLRLGDEALVALTGIRNPCAQIEARFPGLLKRMVHRDESGELHRITGAMAVVVQAGTVRVGDPIAVQVPPGATLPLQLV
ncbi:MAG: MOSC domain-containing protein [Actinomycetota bacterium]